MWFRFRSFYFEFFIINATTKNRTQHQLGKTVLPVNDEPLYMSFHVHVPPDFTDVLHK
jgi:hypothetical protein